MVIEIPGLLSPEQVTKARAALSAAEWVDGRVTAGHQSAREKRNMQVPQDHPAAVQVGDAIVETLGRSNLFLSAALPLKVFPPLFNRYEGGQDFGTHVDNAVRTVPGSPHRVRTDLSATLFLSEPTEYEGGELVIDDAYGSHSVKLPAGHMILYPASSLHRVLPVTRGARVCAFFWVQSMIRDDGRRAILFDMDAAIQRLCLDHPDHPSAVALTGVYHNLVRQWAEL